MFWILPFIYFIFLLYLTLKGINKDKSDVYYFFDSYNTPWIYSLISIIATETSFATVVIFPAIGYQKNFNIIFLCLGYIVGRFIVAIYYLKHYHKLEGISLYEHISEKDSKKVLSIIYLIAKYISGSVRFFLAGYGMYQLTGISTIFWLIVIALFVGIYSGTGGLKSVILTDQFQGYIIFISGIAFVLFIEQNYFDKVYKLNLYKDFNQILDIKQNIILFLGSFLLTISTHGADQDLLQRIFSVREYKKAKISLILSGFLASIVILLFSYLGYQLTIFEDLNKKSPLLDFINFHLNNSSISEILKSLFAVLILSTSMSTLDSAIHSTGVIWKSITENITKFKNYYYSLFSLFIMIIFSFLFIWIEPYKDFFSLAFGSMNYINGALFAFITLYIFYKSKLKKNIIILIFFWNIFIVGVCEYLKLFWATSTIISFLSSLFIGISLKILNRKKE